ncbi:MAG: shikimate kinase AroL [Gemmataceae bacterium]|nr:shikimate kinase AroL [Gemmataceae bacterium]
MSHEQRDESSVLRSSLLTPHSSLLTPHLLPNSSLVFLVGYRATGKTTVARLLAERLGWNWVDADEELERRAGCTIREVFAAEGETGFRDREEAVLAEVCGRERLVVATGGGVVLREANRQRMRAGGRVVWLTADSATIWARLQTDPTTAERRPALTVGGLAEIEELLRQREPLYRACADVVVDTARRSPEDVVNAILQALEASSLTPDP